MVVGGSRVRDFLLTNNCNDRSPARAKFAAEWQTAKLAMLDKLCLQKSAAPYLVNFSPDRSVHQSLNLYLPAAQRPLTVGSDSAAGIELAHCFPKKLCNFQVGYDVVVFGTTTRKSAIFILCSRRAACGRTENFAPPIQVFGESIFLEILAEGVWMDGKPQGPPGIKVSLDGGRGSFASEHHSYTTSLSGSSENILVVIAGQNLSIPILPRIVLTTHILFLTN